VRVEGGPFNWNCGSKELVRTYIWIYLVRWGYFYLGLCGFTVGSVIWQMLASESNSMHKSSESRESSVFVFESVYVWYELL